MAKEELKKTKIVIPSQQGMPDGTDDIFMCVNDRDMLIKRDVEVEVDEAIIDGLDNAVMTEFIINAEGQITGERNVRRFPYQIVK